MGVLEGVARGVGVRELVGEGVGVGVGEALGVGGGEAVVLGVAGMPLAGEVEGLCVEVGLGLGVPVRLPVAVALTLLVEALEGIVLLLEPGLRVLSGEGVPESLGPGVRAGVPDGDGVGEVVLLALEVRVPLGVWVRKRVGEGLVVGDTVPGQEVMEITFPSRATPSLSEAYCSSPQLPEEEVK